MSQPLPTTIKTAELWYCKAGNNTCTIGYPVKCGIVSYFDVQYKENACKPPPFDSLDDKCSNSLCNLKIHVYYPGNNNYTICALPAVILFHGGGYSECGDYDDGGIVAISNALASRGFVVFNVNYRLGNITDIRTVTPTSYEHNSNLTYVSAQQLLAIYRALQDARGAIRSIIAMQGDGTFGSTAHPYRIDTSKIFLGGVSAGSLIALSAGYFGHACQAKINTLFPGVQTAFGGTTGLGPIDPVGVYYANPPALATDDYFGKVKGILNCWGALFVPNAFLSHPYDYFAGQGFALPPIISFCGKKDPVFWYTSQGVYFSPSGADAHNLILNTETRCLPNGSYTVPPDDDIDNPIRYERCIGSQTIYYMLKTPGAGITPIATEFYLDCDAHHGLDDDCSTCTYTSNYGTSASNQAQTYDYIAARAATFFQTILGSTTSNISTSRFVECENTRVRCTGTTTSGCSDSKQCPPPAN